MLFEALFSVTLLKVHYFYIIGVVICRPAPALPRLVGSPYQHLRKMLSDNPPPPERLETFRLIVAGGYRDIKHRHIYIFFFTTTPPLRTKFNRLCSYLLVLLLISLFLCVGGVVLVVAVSFVDSLMGLIQQYHKEDAFIAIKGSTNPP